MFDYEQAVSFIMLAAMSFIALTIFLCLFFAARGPRLTDKIIAVNMICIKTILLIVLTGAYMRKGYLIDVALVYAMLGFFATIVFTRLILQFMLAKSRTKQK